MNALQPVENIIHVAMMLRLFPACAGCGRMMRAGQLRVTMPVPCQHEDAPMATTPCVYLGPDLARYGFGHGHPFGPDRLDAFWHYAQSQGLEAHITQCTPVSAPIEALERFHTRDYVERVIRQSATGEGWLDQGDTPAFPGIHEAACFVVGSVLDAVRRLLKGDCVRAFVPIAGLHHARRDSAAGFCVYNDCGIAIETLRQVHGVRRIAYVDIDAHHGDGVFYSFEDDPDLLFADLHEDGRWLYPGSGAADEISWPTSGVIVSDTVPRSPGPSSIRSGSAMSYPTVDNARAIASIVPLQELGGQLGEFGALALAERGHTAALGVGGRWLVGRARVGRGGRGRAAGTRRTGGAGGLAGAEENASGPAGGRSARRSSRWRPGRRDSEEVQ